MLIQSFIVTSGRGDQNTGRVLAGSRGCRDRRDHISVANKLPLQLDIVAWLLEPFSHIAGLHDHTILTSAKPQRKVTALYIYTGFRVDIYTSLFLRFRGQCEKLKPEPAARRRLKSNETSGKMKGKVEW
eukprot:GHVU01013449.1.p1 GENE.GHVU01013449.1~~GHVU01013449.1.p1  ORF type:complete len:129 (-),score=1.87 GHVU01013449.1:58-444(-)